MQLITQILHYNSFHLKSDCTYNKMDIALHAEHYFATQFEQDLLNIGADSLSKYAPIVRNYQQIVIPFEKRRTQQHQSIIFENSQLEHNKLELLSKIEQLKSENDKIEHALEMQQEKIRELTRKVEEEEKINLDNASVIESLRIRNEDYRSALQHKNSVIAQLQKEKEVLLEKYQAKDSEYNLLLSNCMHDKNLIVEKLNHLNETELRLMDREKELQVQQFYLRKQWQEFEQAMKKSKETPKPREKGRIFGSQIIGERDKEDQPRDSKKKQQKDAANQILKNPLRKIIRHHHSEIYDLSFNYSGNLLATCGGDRHIKVYDVSNARVSQSIPSNSAESLFISMALDYGGERLLAGSTDKTVSIFNSQSGKHLHSFLGHGDKVNSVSWTNYKEKCVSGSDDKQLKIWDIERAANVLSAGCQKSVKVVRSNYVQPVVYTGHADGSVRVYSISQGNSPVSQIKGLIDYSITSLTLLSNRHHILVTSMEGSAVQLLDLKMNKCIGKYQHEKFYNSAAHATISPSQALVLAGNCDGSIYYWNRYKGDLVHRVTGHDGPVTALQYHFMSSTLATADKDGSLILWQ